MTCQTIIVHPPISSYLRPACYDNIMLLPYARMRLGVVWLHWFVCVAICGQKSTCLVPYHLKNPALCIILLDYGIYTPPKLF